MLEILILWFSMSARNPNLQPNPYDYELSTGYEIKMPVIKSQGRFLIERENGNEYNGRIHDHSVKYFAIGEYIKTAKKISRQKAIVKRPFTKWGIKQELGAGGIWRDYAEGKFTLYGKLESKYLSAEWAGLEQTEMFKAKIKTKFLLREHFFIEPLAMYFTDGKREDWQAKIKFGFQFKK